MSELIWTPVRTLGGACDQVPTALDKETLGTYAERCGKEQALKWAAKETGVDVAGCANVPTKQVPECIANNYGITFDVTNKDGSINWNNVVRDSGAVGGIIVCAATGVGAAGLSFCGKVGAELAQIFIEMSKVTAGVVKLIISVFWNGDEGTGYACGKSTGYVLEQYASRDIAVYLKTVRTVGAPAASSMKLGPVMPGTDKIIAGNTGPNWQVYWGRVFALRGLAQATASLIAEISRKAGVSPAVAAQALAPEAPPGWSDLVRPLLGPITQVGGGLSVANKYDVIGNIGGVLDAMIYPKTDPDTIRPSWQSSAFWTGIDSGPSSDKIWRYFSLTVGCPGNIVAWGEIQNFDAAKKLLSTSRDQGTVVLSNKSTSNRWNWWVYSTPKMLDALLRTQSDTQFKLLVSKWRASLEKDVNAKITKARSLGSSSSSALPAVAGAGAVGLLLWWLFF